MKKQLLLFVTMLMAVVMPMKLWAADGNAEPYAVLSDNDTKLTFFYDDQKDARGGLSVGPFYVNDSGSIAGRQWNYSSITTVVFDNSFANCISLTSTAYWFSGCLTLTMISGIGNLRTDNVTDMREMFRACSNLTNVDVSGFKTDNVTDMGWMFAGCSGLTSLDVSGFNTSNVTNMSGMFYDCEGLTSLDVSGFNTANVTDMSSMFSTCSSLKNLDLSGFNTSKVIDMRYMFSYCAELKTIYTGSGWSTDKVENGDGMFDNCTSLVGGAGTVYDANHTDYTYAHIDGGTSNPGYFTANNERVINGKFVMTDYSSFAIGYNYQIQELTPSNIVEDSDDPNNLCVKVVSLDDSNPNQTGESEFLIRIGEPLQLGQKYTFSMRAKANRNAAIQSLALKDNYEYLHWKMVGNCDLTTEWNTYTYEAEVVAEQVGCLTIAFCLDLESQSTEYFFDDISFRVNEAPSASPEPYAVLSDNNTVLKFYYDDQKDARGGMGVGPFEDLGSSGVSTEWYGNKSTITTVVFDDSFANCTTLTSTAYWFYQLTKLTTITGIQNLKMDNVNDINSMFCDCESLTSLNLSSLNLGNVTNMHQMFEGCTGLENIIFAGVNTENVTNMGDLFLNCRSLKTIDLSSFNTSKVTNMAYMFYRCTSLTTVYVSDSWTTANVTNSERMFERCNNIVGGMGTTFDENIIDASYARIDGGASNPGYFTSKDAPEGKTKVESIRFEQDGEYLRMTSPTDGAKIFYTMHYVNYGTTQQPGEPRENGYRLWMPYSCTVDAYALKEDYENSDTTRFVYTKPAATYEFDGRVLRVSNEGETGPLWIRMSDIPYSETITAVVWNSEEQLSARYLDGINNPNLLVYVNEASLAPEGVQNVVINGLAREIVLTDAQDGNNDWYAPQAFVAERISYTRNFGQSTTKGTSRGWESIALPFDVQTIQHESKGVMAPFNNSASNKHFWLRRLTDNGLQAATNIEANTPYIISMPNSEEYTSDYNLNGRVTFSAQNIDVPATTTKVLALADSSIVMVPAMQRQSRSSSVWALNVGEVRGQYFEGSVFERDYRTVRPFEAYTIHRQENGQPAPRYVPIQEIAGVTGIETIDREPLTLNQWYDMQGRKLEGKPARKGVYISNGKKVVVK